MDHNKPTYRQFVKSMARGNPCLAGLDSFLQNSRVSSSNVVGYVDYSRTDLSASAFTRLNSEDYATLRTIPPEVEGRVLFIQDIDANMVEFCGTAFDIDPMFFAGYITTYFRNLEIAPPPPSLALLPSQHASRNYAHIHYQKVLDLGSAEGSKDLPYRMETNSNVTRSIVRLPSVGGRQIRLARGCCALTVQNFSNSWLCIILVDSPSQLVVARNELGRQSYHTAKLLYQGFEDFENPPTFSAWATGEQEMTGRDLRESPLETLVHYFKELPPSYRKTKAASNKSVFGTLMLSLSYYPIRIALGHWMLYTHLMSRFVKHYEFALSGIQTQDNGLDIHDLQCWRRRSKQNLRKLELVSDFIDIWAIEDEASNFWQPVRRDINFISAEITKYNHSLEGAVPLATSVVQLQESRQSIAEAVNVRRLTYIALIFAPMSWVASIFSMQERFVPGNSGSWIYFVTAIPLMGFVLALSILDLDTNPIFTYLKHTKKKIFM